VNLVVSGSIVGGDGCSPLSDVKIQFFHVVNDLFDGNLVEEEGDLREMSCQGAVASDAQGRFQLETTIPPSYGPPRHLNLMISTPGYRTLLTRVYFSQDIRLQQLSVGNAVVGGHETGGAFETSYHFPTLQNSRPLLREVLSLEPRVCDLAFVDDATGGRLECRHDVVLQPDFPEFSSTELSGYWAESDGSLVRVETSGHFFFATQHPHLRTWGSISGIVHGNSIFGANFRNSGPLLSFLSLR
jgi:protocatechuate 3,4-dioxygenase beta subunit